MYPGLFTQWFDHLKDSYWTSDNSCGIVKKNFYRLVCIWNNNSRPAVFPWLVFLFAVCYILEKESKDFASCVFSSGLFMVHDASWGGQHNVSVETKRQYVMSGSISVSIKTDGGFSEGGGSKWIKSNKTNTSSRRWPATGEWSLNKTKPAKQRSNLKSKSFLYTLFEGTKYTFV